VIQRRETPTAIPPQFRKVELLGRGRTGAVYLVKEEKSGGFFALKLLSPDYSPEALAQLLDESGTLKHLHHPYLPRIERFATTGEGTPYLLREFVPGTPLRPGPPPKGSDPKRYLRPILDVLGTLTFLHHHGLAHLDLHAGNVIERRDGSSFRYSALLSRA
jgi:protein-serine/threonine kinase